MSAALLAPALCATAACHDTAVTVTDGWPACSTHAFPERENRSRSWEAYTTLRTWVGRLQHAGLTDPEIAAVVGVCPTTVRDHRRRLDLPANRSWQQQVRDDRRAREADERISRCSCTGWRWDGHCHRCTP